MLRIITVAGHLRVRLVGVLMYQQATPLVPCQTERVDGKWEDWSHHDSSYSGTP